MNENQNTGLLDLSVELSTRDIMAGNDFTLYVLIKNPFSKPVWIRRVHVNLPSELKLAETNEEIKKEEQKIKNQADEQSDEQNVLNKNIENLKKDINDLLEKNEENTSDIKVKLNEKINKLIEEINAYKTDVNLYIADAKIGDLKIASKKANVYISSNDDNVTKTGDIEIIEPWLIKQKLASVRKVELESSLPANTALQPGNTVVYSIVLNVKKSLLFSPSKYRLQFNANYCFNYNISESVELNNTKQDDIFTNTISYELSIRASIYSVITGSAIGGLVGGVARILQLSQSSSASILTSTNALALAAAIILGIMAIIFMARKSDSQSFISVEDFWGGILVGFFVGYTGTSFFETLTGVATPINGI
ncbi:MAG: hypothetical protein GY749_04395 [Desulfobacteraceae bacterium]|nr:hypothetical protein [Desulfobacteraceae bacterium]